MLFLSFFTVRTNEPTFFHVTSSVVPFVRTNLLDEPTSFFHDRRSSFGSSLSGRTQTYNQAFFLQLFTTRFKQKISNLLLFVNVTWLFVRTSCFATRFLRDSIFKDPLLFRFSIFKPFGSRFLRDSIFNDPFLKNRIYFGSIFKGLDF